MAGVETAGGSPDALEGKGGVNCARTRANAVSDAAAEGR